MICAYTSCRWSHVGYYVNIIYRHMHTIIMIPNYCKNTYKSIIIPMVIEIFTVQIDKQLFFNYLISFKTARSLDKVFGSTILHDQ